MFIISLRGSEKGTYPYFVDGDTEVQAGPVTQREPGLNTLPKGRIQYSDY